jgi:hypothetical protein
LWFFEFLRAWVASCKTSERKKKQKDHPFFFCLWVCEFVSLCVYSFFARVKLCCQTLLLLLFIGGYCWAAASQDLHCIFFEVDWQKSIEELLLLSSHQKEKTKALLSWSIVQGPIVAAELHGFFFLSLWVWNCISCFWELDLGWGNSGMIRLIMEVKGSKQLAGSSRIVGEEGSDHHRDSSQRRRKEVACCCSKNCW